MNNKSNKNTEKKIKWVLRFAISKNAIYWCSKHRIKGKFKYCIYKDLPPGAYQSGIFITTNEKEKQEKKEKEICFLLANLYYIREEEKKAGVQRNDCDLSDVEDMDDEYRKEAIKKILNKLDDKETGTNRVIHLCPNA